MKHSRIIFSFCLAFIAYSCNHTQKSNEIESIEVLYYNYILETDLPEDCGDIQKVTPLYTKSNVYDSQTHEIIEVMYLYYGVLDTIITDSLVLKEIANEINKLEIDKDNTEIDARMSISINFKDGSKKQLCLGNYIVNDIMYDGKVQKQNNRLLYLIKYHSGFYSWMDDSFLVEMDELKDSTFVREPITGIMENPIYKKMLEE